MERGCFGRGKFWVENLGGGPAVVLELSEQARFGERGWWFGGAEKWVLLEVFVLLTTEW